MELMWLAASVIQTMMGSEPLRNPTPPMVPTSSVAGTGAGGAVVGLNGGVVQFCVPQLSVPP